MKRITLAIVALLVITGCILFIVFRGNDSVEDVSSLASIPSPTIPSSQTSTVPSSPEQTAYRITLPEELRVIIEENRALALPPPHPELREILYSYQPRGLDAATDAAIAERIRQSMEAGGDSPEYLSHDEIIEELNFLFDLLKYGYAAYEYFGGDRVFEAVKQLMLASLALMPDPVSNERYLNELLVTCLQAVIADNHFWIAHNHQLGISSQFYLNEEYIVYRDENGYMTEIDGQVYKILQAGQDMEGLLPTLTPDGELAWAFGKLITGGENHSGINMDVMLENVETNEASTRSIGLLSVSDDYRASLSQDLYAIREINGITIVENRQLFSIDDNGLPLSEFANTGRMVRDEPVLILDLRGNGGGNAVYAYDWILQYTDEQPVFAITSMGRLHSATTNAFVPWINAHSPPSWVVQINNEYNLIANNNLVIVLTDNGIGSSGEYFIGFLRQLENVLFVGTNTMGNLLACPGGVITLPSSKQLISFGIDLNIRPDLSQFEGIGLMPDLWVPPGESLERVLRFIERYE